MTPLHLTALGGHKEATKIIIDSGAMLNLKNIYGETPLDCLLYTSPSPRDGLLSRMPSSA